MLEYLDGLLAGRFWWRNWRGGHFEKWWNTQTHTSHWFKVRVCYHFTCERPEGYDVCLRCEEAW